MRDISLKLPLSFDDYKKIIEDKIAINYDYLLEQVDVDWDKVIKNIIANRNYSFISIEGHSQAFGFRYRKNKPEVATLQIKAVGDQGHGYWHPYPIEDFDGSIDKEIKKDPERFTIVKKHNASKKDTRLVRDRVPKGTVICFTRCVETEHVRELVKRCLQGKQVPLDVEMAVSRFGMTQTFFQEGLKKKKKRRR